MTVLRAADLFCGAGGSSTGLQRVADALGARLDLTAVNHWPEAVETHAANHPDARHVCEPIDSVVPRRVTGGDLDLLWASPSCTNHSHAKGDKAIDDEDRATAWAVIRWAEVTRAAWVIVENVPAFLDWGPLGRNGRRSVALRGQVFRAWLAALGAIGYTLDYRILNSADYGAATARPRLFVVGRFDGARARGPIPWPVQTHAEPGTAPLLADIAPWRGAREVIDWSIPGRSIYDRPVPLAEKTMRRIAEGVRRFGGRPFVLGQQSGSVPRLVTDPLPTIATKGAISLVQPFLIAYYGSGANVSPVSAPLRTITTRDRFGLVRAEGGDLTLRMLRLHELAAAMGFPSDYRFSGTATDAKAMVGNAVEVNQAAALWRHPVEHVLGIDRKAA